MLKAGFRAERHEAKSEDREQRHHGFDGAPTHGSEHGVNVPGSPTTGKICALGRALRRGASPTCGQHARQGPETAFRVRCTSGTEGAMLRILNRPRPGGASTRTASPPMTSAMAVRSAPVGRGPRSAEEWACARKAGTLGAPFRQVPKFVRSDPLECRSVVVATRPRGGRQVSVSVERSFKGRKTRSRKK